MSKINKTKKTPQKKYETQEALETMNTWAVSAESFLQKYAKYMGIVFGVVVLIALGYVLYQNFVITPKNTQASDLVLDAENLYLQGKADQALGGRNGGISGFSDIAEDYGSTASGKLAALYAGVIEFKKGDYQKALDFFQKFDSPDKDLKAVKYGAIADTYVELNNNEEALNYMTKAAKESTSGATAFQFNKKAGILAMAMGQNDKALEFFQTIKDKYSDVDQSGEIDAYIERLKYATGKE